MNGIDYIDKFRISILEYVTEGSLHIAERYTILLCTRLSEFREAALEAWSDRQKAS